MYIMKKSLRVYLGIVMVLAMLIAAFPMRVYGRENLRPQDIVFNRFIAVLTSKQPAMNAIEQLNRLWGYDFPFMSREVAENIISEKLIEWKVLPTEVASNYVDVYRYSSGNRKVYVYYVGLDEKVKKENKYFINGPMYYLVVVAGSPDEGFKVVEFSTAPSDQILAAGYGFNSDTEKAFARILQFRDKQLFVDYSGKVLEDNRYKGQYDRPSSIRVYLTNPANYRAYGCMNRCTKSIDFYYYVKNVLPNEWIVGSWSFEAVKAGAMAVKMYGWYYTKYPKWSRYNADVMDNTNDQVFRVGSEHWRGTAAVNAVGGIGIRKRWGIFVTHYYAGSYSPAGRHSGWMSQWGSKYLADHGYNWKQILDYYYSKDNNPIIFWRYY